MYGALDRVIQAALSMTLASMVTPPRGFLLTQQFAKRQGRREPLTWTLQYQEFEAVSTYLIFKDLESVL